MAAGVDLLQLADADLGVDRGGFEVFMTEQPLDVADVGPAFEHVGGAGVAQQVATALAAHSGLFHPPRDHARNDIGIERAAITGQEQRLPVPYNTAPPPALIASFVFY